MQAQHYPVSSCFYYSIPSTVYSLRLFIYDVA
uniref:Uncharacterized protein n=1 Tax=Arundo donax TaxID=35708 RepID=A0A0A9CFD2_ARUDO